MPTGVLQPVETQGNDDGRCAKHQWQTSASGRSLPDDIFISTVPGWSSARYLQVSTGENLWSTHVIFRIFK